MRRPKRTPAAQKAPKSQKVPAVVTVRCKLTKVFETMNELVQLTTDTIETPSPRNFDGRISLATSHGKGPTPNAYELIKKTRQVKGNKPIRSDVSGSWLLI